MVYYGNYKIIVTRNGDYIAGNYVQVEDLIKVFDLQTDEEFNKVIKALNEMTSNQIQTIFYAKEHEKENFDIIKFLEDDKNLFRMGEGP